jgi:hypothetical protein
LWTTVVPITNLAICWNIRKTAVLATGLPNTGEEGGSENLRVFGIPAGKAPAFSEKVDA